MPRLRFPQLDRAVLPDSRRGRRVVRPPPLRRGSRPAPGVALSPAALVSLREAYAACERITKRAGANFSVGFRFLPPEKRRAVYAAYAFCRLADDLADESEITEAPALLARWEEELEETYAGRPRHPVSVALADALTRYPIPKSGFAGLIDGCRDDLVKLRYTDEADLMVYVAKVAWTISDISLSIFGPLPGKASEAYERGRDLATGLQLTNICRDVGDDLRRNRIYLPAEDLERFGITEAVLRERSGGEAFRALMEFECARAAAAFERARNLPSLLSEDCRLAVALMGGVYAAVLRKVRANTPVVLERRVALSLPEKLAVVAARRKDRVVA